ncbi:STAS/SEC14 domain-containing protein [candidate division WOR-3 bacterium]|nr:STAS/SEC14 domain-containing protein [candidate division WOR-3 bacterium]
MNYEMWQDKKEGVVRIKIKGKFGSEDNREFIKGLEEKFAGSEHRAAVIDVSEGEFSIPKRGNRERMVQRIKELDFERIAFVGASPLVKMMMMIIAMSLGKKGSIGSFNEDDEALIWIQSQKVLNKERR